MTNMSKVRCQAAKDNTPYLQLSFSNIRGLRSNLDEVSHFLQARSPDVFAVSETKLDSSVASSDLTPAGYTLHRLDRAPCHGLALYAKTSLPLRRLLESEDSRHEYLAFIAPLRSRTVLMFFVYRSPSSDSEVFDVLSTKIDSLLQKYPAAEVTVFGDLNVHNQEWLIHSRSTDTSGLAAQTLTQIVTSPTRVPDRDGDLDISLICSSPPC